MKNIIYKYELSNHNYQEIEIPIGSKILSVKEQNNKICIWCLANPNNKLSKRKIQIVGTDQEIEFFIGNFSYYFLDTIVMSNGLVFHLFTTNN